MKSLEFINKDLQDFEKALEDYKKRKEILNEEVDEEYIKQITKEIERYKQIKQDLEVLEIIYKKNVDISWLKENLEVVTLGIYPIEDALKGYNSIKRIEHQLTLEELLKLKQWLEKEEN